MRISNNKGFSNVGLFKRKVRPEFNAKCSCAALDRGNFMPARDYEAHTGLEGLAGDWRLPPGETPDSYQAHLLSAYRTPVFAHYDQNLPYNQSQITPGAPELMRALNADWDALVALNPALAAVDIQKDSPRDFYHGLLGAASQFNVDDINLFLQEPRRTNEGSVAATYLMSSTSPAALLADDIMKRTGARLSWVPSMKTLGKMKAQLDAKGPRL